MKKKIEVIHFNKLTSSIKRLKKFLELEAPKVLIRNEKAILLTKIRNLFVYLDDLQLEEEFEKDLSRTDFEATEGLKLKIK